MSSIDSNCIQEIIVDCNRLIFDNLYESVAYDIYYRGRIDTHHRVFDGIAYKRHITGEFRDRQPS